MTELVKRIRALAESARDGDLATVAKAELELRHLLADNRDEILTALEAKDAISKRAFVMSEPHLSGHRVCIGFERGEDASVAFYAISKALPTPATEGEAMSKIGNHRVGLQETDAYRWGRDWAELGMDLHHWMLPHLGTSQAEAAKLGWQDYHDQEPTP